MPILARKSSLFVKNRYFWLKSNFWPLSRGDRSKITCHFRWEIISTFRIRWENSKIPTRTGARGENVTARHKYAWTRGHVFTSSSGSGWNFWIFLTDSESWDDFPSKMTCFFWPISTGKGSKTRLKSKIRVFDEKSWRAFTFSPLAPALVGIFEFF